MKIISNYKDYYDYLSYQYGVEEDMIYHRQSLTPIDIDEEELCFISYKDKNPFDLKFNINNKRCYETRDKFCEIDTIIIIGVYHHIVNEKDKLSGNVSMRICKNRDVYNKNMWRLKYGDEPYWWYPEKENRKLLEDDNQKLFTKTENFSFDSYLCNLHFMLKQPVLWRWTEDKNGQKKIAIPNLSSIKGFSGWYPPETLYRDLYNFFTILKSREKKEEFIEIDDNSKLQKHGFDKKTSFRHPVIVPSRKKQ